MTVNMEKPYVVGMDIGGTNTVFGVVDSRGNVLASDSIKTQNLFLFCSNSEVQRNSREWVLVPQTVTITMEQ